MALRILLFLLLLAFASAACQTVVELPSPTTVPAPTPAYTEGAVQTPPGHLFLIEWRDYDSLCAVWEEPSWLYLQHQDGVVEIRREAPAALPAVGYYGQTILEIYGDTLTPIEQLPFSAEFTLLSILADGTAVVESDGVVRQLRPGEAWKLTSRQVECSGDRVEEVFTAIFNHGWLNEKQIAFRP